MNPTYFFLTHKSACVCLKGKIQEENTGTLALVVAAKPHTYLMCLGGRPEGIVFLFLEILYRFA